MKLHPFVWALLLAASTAAGQSYYITLNKGVTDEFDMSAPSGRVIMQSPLNDALSAAQTIPFAWSFYGEPVASYRASDNGYITFDAAAASSAPDNTALPNAAAPNGAIYAFWDNLELSNNPSFMTNTVKTYTVGAAPNRIHVIQWHATPLGRPANGNYLYFALRLYEAGGFDVILQQIRLDAGVMTGTLGCENGEGTLGTMAPGSPNLTYTGGVYIKENVPVYTFTFGAQRARDALMKELTVPEIVAVNRTYPVTGTIVNHGTATIASLDLAYQVDADPVQRASLTGLNVAPNASCAFTHPAPWQPAGAGSFRALRAWVERINGAGDEWNGDDTTGRRIFVTLGTSAPKKVLIEEYSTAPCGYCPDGAIVIEGIRSRHPEVLTMTHHSGYLSDAMTLTESATIAGEFANGAPTATVDRILWPGTIRVAISRTDWEQRASDAAALPSPLALGVRTSFDPPTRALTVTCEGEFVDYAYPAGLRLNVFVVEDSVTGTGSGYDQANYYNDTPGHPLYQKGNPIVGYAHRHVLRAAPTGAWGDASVLTQNAAPGMTFTKTYTYIIPAGFKEKDISVIAFVAYRDGGRNAILNAADRPDILSAAGSTPVPSKWGISLFPNPASHSTIARLSLDRRASVQLVIFDPLGRASRREELGEREAGEHLLSLNLAPLPPGLYLVAMQGDGRISFAKLTVMR